HLHAEGGYGEGFRDRANGKQRMRGHRRLLLQVAVAVALRENYFIALHDRDGQARYLPVFHGLRDEFVEPVKAGLCGRRGCRGRRWYRGRLALERKRKCLPSLREVPADLVAF